MPHPINLKCFMNPIPQERTFGELIPAERALPPSPVEDDEPVPAIVEMVPQASVEQG